MKKTLVGVVAVAFVALMIANAYACGCECECDGYTPGFWKHNIAVALEYKPGAYSAFNDGTKLTEAMLMGYAATAEVTLEEAYDDLTAHGFEGADMVRADMANAFNAAAGFGPFDD